jgi:hypothetical protein
MTDDWHKIIRRKRSSSQKEKVLVRGREFLAYSLRVGEG